MNARAQVPTFDAATRVKLAKICGMMGSAHDGEALSAARKAHALLTSCGKTWTDAVCGHSPAASSSATPKTARKPRAAKTPEPRTCVDICEIIVKSPAATEWERGFARDLLENWRGRDLSRRQMASLREIWMKLKPKRRGRKAGRR